MKRHMQPGETARQRLEQMNTPEARFCLAGLRRNEAHGGQPRATLESGKIVFTYPDGTRLNPPTNR